VARAFTRRPCGYSYFTRLRCPGRHQEYPVGSDVAANAALKPLTELDEPDIDEAKLNGREVVDMMTKAGLL